MKRASDPLLRDFISLLVKGWGSEAVHAAFIEVSGYKGPSKRRPNRPTASVNQVTAVELVGELALPADRKMLLEQIAREFDESQAFAKISDIRSFLASHNQGAKDLKTRQQGFRKMLPLLLEMSEKGLVRIISDSKHSGPAALDSISDAIKSAGDTLRGASGSTPEINEG